MLHPGLKLEYFRQQDWEAEWVDNAMELVREEYKAHYDGKYAPMVPTAADGATVSYYLFLVILELTVASQDDDDEFATFSNISVTKHVGSRSSELKEYFRKPVENVKDPLKWWVANRHIYSNLYRMALDYLSIPGKYLSCSLCYICVTNCIL